MATTTSKFLGAAVLAASLTLSGCGFHLRGDSGHAVQRIQAGVVIPDQQESTGDDVGEGAGEFVLHSHHHLRRNRVIAPG